MIPIPVITPEGIVEGILKIDLELGNPLPSGRPDREVLHLQLKLSDQDFKAEAKKLDTTVRAFAPLRWTRS